MSDTSTGAGKPAQPARKRRGAAAKPDRRVEILDATQRLMVESGYAAVSTRRVAAAIGIKPSLVHYYFPTTDDLFLALFRRGVQREAEKLDAAAQSPKSLEALWDAYCHPPQMALAIEFMALANHREAIREEIVSVTERERARRAQLLSSLVDLDRLAPGDDSAHGLSVLLIAVARTLIMEEGLGIELGHREANRLVVHWLRALALPSAVE